MNETHLSRVAVGAGSVVDLDGSLYRLTVSTSIPEDARTLLTIRGPLRLEVKDGAVVDVKAFEINGRPRICIVDADGFSLMSIDL